MWWVRPHFRRSSSCVGNHVSSTRLIYNELLHIVSTKCNYEHFMYFSAEFGENLNATWNSTTPSVKALSHDREYFFLPYWDDKPTMWIRATFPDHRRRMYNSNTISKVVEKLVSMEEDIFSPYLRNGSHFDIVPSASWIKCHYLVCNITYWIIGITWLQDEQLKEVHNMIEMEEEGCDAKFRNMFEQLQTGKLGSQFFNIFTW